MPGKPTNLAIDSSVEALANPDGIDPTTPGSRRLSYMARYPTGRRPSELSPNGAPLPLNSPAPAPTPKGPSVVAARRESQLTPKTPKYLPVQVLLPADESRFKKGKTRINALGQEEEVKEEDSDEYTSSEDEEEEEVRIGTPFLANDE